MAKARRKRSLPHRIITLWAALTLLSAALCFLRIREEGTAGLIPPSLPGYDVEAPEYVRQDYLPENPYSRPGTFLRTINGVVIHYVGNPGSTAKGNRSYFASLASGKDGVYASSHYIVGLEGEVIQCVPLTEIAYCSNSRNSDTISIEVCHPDDSGQFSDVTYSRAVELTAWLCDTFGLTPGREVIRHYDVSGKECPRYYVRNPEAWEGYKADVAAILPWASGGEEE